MWNSIFSVLLLAIGTQACIVALLARRRKLPRSRWLTLIDGPALRVSDEAWNEGQRATWKIQLALALIAFVGGFGLLFGSVHQPWWTAGWGIALTVLTLVGRSVASKAVWRAGLVRRTPSGSSVDPAPR